MNTVPQTGEFEAKLKRYIQREKLTVDPATTQLLLFLYEEFREALENERDAVQQQIAGMERTLWKKEK